MESSFAVNARNDWIASHNKHNKEIKSSHLRQNIILNASVKKSLSLTLYNLLIEVSLHFEALVKEKIEYPYALENYCLYRAIQALNTIDKSLKYLKRDKLLSGCTNYFTAIYGEEIGDKNCSSKMLEKMVQNGDISLIQKFNTPLYRDSRAYKLYIPEHQALKKTTIHLAKLCQEQLLKKLYIAEKKQILWVNEISEMSNMLPTTPLHMHHSLHTPYSYLDIVNLIDEILDKQENNLNAFFKNDIRVY